MTPLTDLRKRVRAASGPDRELDRDIGWAFGSSPVPIGDGLYDWLSYTASVDSALALVERRLPGVDIHFEIEQVHGGFCQYVYLGPGGAISPVRDSHSGGKFYKTWAEALQRLPLAVVEAFLTALIAQQEQEAR